MTRNPSGEAHPGWKGDAVSYSALHHWVRRYKAKPVACQHCNASDKPLEWANISRAYRRDLDDWIALCKKCHTAYDRAAECRNGHARTPENTFVDYRGIRKCRVCQYKHQRRRYYERQGRAVPA